MNMHTEIAAGYCDNIHSRHASEGGGRNSPDKLSKKFNFVQAKQAL